MLRAAYSCRGIANDGRVLAHFVFHEFKSLWLQEKV
jgi:hypothetical protein